MEDDEKRMQKEFLKAIDVPYSYSLAKRMEEIKSNPVLGFRTAGSAAELQQEKC